MLEMTVLIIVFIVENYGFWSLSLEKVSAN